MGKKRKHEAPSTPESTIHVDALADRYLSASEREAVNRIEISGNGIDIHLNRTGIRWLRRAVVSASAVLAIATCDVPHQQRSTRPLPREADTSNAPCETPTDQTDGSG